MIASFDTEAAALQAVARAEAEALRRPESNGVVPTQVSKAAVIGGGTMGVGIAAAFRNAGFPVTLVERDSDAADQARSRVAALFYAAVRRGKLTPAEASERETGILYTTGFDDLGDIDLAIEAVVEDLDTKRKVFGKLEAYCRDDAILATNTSYLDPREIVRGLRTADRIIGLHFFSPAHVMRLVEVIALPETADAVLLGAIETVRRLGKLPVRAGICEGFIGNRMLKRYRAAAEELVRQGVAIAAIDAAMRDYGFAMGPFEAQDLAGLDIAFAQREADRSGGKDCPETLGDILVAAGRLGQKVGRGWYDYSPGGRQPIPSPKVESLLSPYIEKTGSTMPRDIASFLVAELEREGRKLLAEGIARSAADIDLVQVFGFGFPRCKGGPMFASDRGH